MEAKASGRAVVTNDRHGMLLGDHAGVMDSDTARHLLRALQGSGLHTPAALAEAERYLGAAAPPEDLTLADELFKLQLLTPYMFRKVRTGRTAEILFGPFLILDKLGEGGMGKVYRALQVPRQQVVALKVVRQHLMNNKTVRKRYEKEAAAAAALDHPNIVKLYNADEINGRYYLAMEYVDGIDLSRMVKEFGQPPQTGLPMYQEAAEYIRQAALGLQHAHDRGLIHRDIKPSNLLVYGERALPTTSGRAIVKVLDMGLVRSLIESDDEANTELTRDGTVVGTPDYMSPEQAKNSSTVDARADQYSLGCTLYYLLRGRAPYPEGTPIDKLLRHQLDPIPDLKQERPELPGRLCDLVRRMMEKRPEDRFATMQHVAEALAEFTKLEEPPEYAPFDFSLPGTAPDRSIEATNTHASGPTIPDGPTLVQPRPTPPPSPSGPAKPAVRLKVVQPSSGEVRAATPRTPPTIAKPQPATPIPAKPTSTRRPPPLPDPSANSDSLPGTSAPTTPTRTETRSQPRADSPRTPVASPMSRPRAKVVPLLASPASNAVPQTAPDKTPRRPGSRWPIAVYLAIAAVALLLLLVPLALLLRSFWLGPAPVDGTTDTTPAAEVAGLPKPATPPEPDPALAQPLKSPRAPARPKARWIELIPDDTRLMVVLRPKSFFAWQEFSTASTPRWNAFLKDCLQRLRLDVRRIETASLCWVGPQQDLIVHTEGPFLAPDFATNLANRPGVRRLDSARVDRFEIPNNTGLDQLALWAPGTYTLATDAPRLDALIARGPSDAPKAVPPAWLTAAEPAGPKLPLAFVVFGSEFQLPDGPTLGQLSIVGGQLIMQPPEGPLCEIELRLDAINLDRLDDFISLELSTRLPERFPATKSWFEWLNHAEVTKTLRNNRAEYRAKAKLSLPALIESLEKLIPTPRAN